MERLSPIRERLRRFCIRSALVSLIGAVAFCLAEITSPTAIYCHKIDFDILRLREAEYQLDWYKASRGDYPPEHTGLNDLLKKGDPSELYFMNRIRQDSWGRPLIYRHVPGSRQYQLYSVGVNGIDEQGKGDDISASRPSGEYRCDDYGINCLPDPVEVIKLISGFSVAVSLLVFLVSGFMLCIASFGLIVTNRFR